MAWSKRQFVNSAYEEIGYADYNFDIQPEQMDKAVRKLDSMMGQWDIRGVRVGYPLVGDPEEISIDIEFEVPLFATDAIIYNLAVLLAPSVGKIASPETKKAAKEALVTLSGQTIDMPTKQFPRRLPLGAGNKRFARNTRQTFFIPQQKTPPSEENTIEDNV